MFAAGAGFELIIFLLSIWWVKANNKRKQA